ncbi:MAG: VOC family protein [Candidatus Dormibacteria bacterium]
MSEVKTAVEARPIWADLSSSDATASRAYYSNLFGWQVEVSPDPQYGGYAIAQVGGQDVAGIGSTQSTEQPTAWSVYFGTQDADQLVTSVTAAGGKVLVPVMDVGDQGRMVILQDPSGAVFGAWQPVNMAGFHSGAPNTFGWTELNSRGLATALPFYQKVFNWTVKKSDMPAGAPPYNEFQLGGNSIAGAQDMQPMVPADVPDHWMVYFYVADVDATARKAVTGGGHELVAPMDFPGGRFSIIQDPQGAVFGLLKMSEG